MPLLKELIRTFAYPAEYQATIAALVSKLRGLGIHVEQVDEEEGIIEARCLGLAADWIFWKCWSDRVLLKVERVSKNTTNVKLYAIPNLLRLGPGGKEKVIDFDTLAAQLTT